VRDFSRRGSRKDSSHAFFFVCRPTHRHRGAVYPAVERLFRDTEIDELIADDDLQNILTLNLAKAVQIAVDIGTSIIAESDVCAPITTRAVFDRLESLGELSPATANRLRLAAGFRNLAIHRYESIDWFVVFTACREGPDDLRAFAAEITRSRFDEE